MEQGHLTEKLLGENASDNTVVRLLRLLAPMLLLKDDLDDWFFFPSPLLWLKRPSLGVVKGGGQKNSGEQYLKHSTV